MTTPRSDFLHQLDQRGFIYGNTNAEELDTLMRGQVVPAYIGFDATAPSLHVGSLVQIMMLRWLQKTGHKPIVLMGGGTTKVGDPSGRDTSRQLLTPGKIEENKAGIQRVFAKYLTFGDGPTDAVMIDNAEWLDHLNYIEFLRDYGRHFSINTMLTMESVSARLEREQHLSFLEFNYMLLQAYDFVELNKRLGARLQMGGSDQWGNIVNGIELSRRMGGDKLFGVTTPLLTTADGRKMGKSAAGAVWLDGDMLSPYEFWQFWRNTLDADVGRFLRLFTELEMDEIARLEALDGAEINSAKVTLANAVTTLAHGAAAAAEAEATARETFERGGAGAGLPTIEIARADIGEGISAVQLFVRAGLAASGKEAKRLIAEGGARIDDAALTDAGRVLGAAEFGDGLKLSAGKKRHALARIVD